MILGSNLERRRRKSLTRLASKFGVAAVISSRDATSDNTAGHRNSLTLTAY